MAPQKESKLIKWLNTVMLSLITAGIIWSGNTLISIRESIAKQGEKNDKYDMMFTELKKNYDSEKNRSENNETRLTTLEALLPDKIKGIKIIR